MNFKTSVVVRVVSRCRGTPVAPTDTAAKHSLTIKTVSNRVLYGGTGVELARIGAVSRKVLRISFDSRRGRG